MLNRLAFTLLFVLALPVSGQTCRQALALGLDVSGSVDLEEYRLQLDGLAAALTDAEVAEAILSTPSVPIYVAIFEWSGRSYQRLIVDWQPLVDQNTLDQVATRLRQWQREPAPETTGLGAALEFGAALLSRHPTCSKATLDISGDGKNNVWPRPKLVHNSGLLDGIVVNGLVIGNELFRPAGSEAEGIAELTAYYQSVVIRGPGAFVESALGFQDYEAAMKRKLLREIATFALSSK